MRSASQVRKEYAGTTMANALERTTLNNTTTTLPNLGLVPFNLFASVVCPQPGVS